jgi:TRAP transporter TAXI family solute receptor
LLIPLFSAPAYAAQETGFAVKKPVFGGACIRCPWGAIGDLVKKAMAPYGYDVQVCYNCAGGPQEVRMVAGAKMPPPQSPESLAREAAIGIAANQTPPPPKGPVDFGAATTDLLIWAYQGTHDFKAEGPRKDLRLIATLPTPLYEVVAVRKGSGITDLSQLKSHPGVKILWDGVMHKDGASDAVLAYYGVSARSIEAAGGKMLNGTDPSQRKDFDVLIYIGDLSNTPEFGVLYEVSQTHDLTFLELPKDLRDQLARDYDMVEGVMPAGYFKGQDRAIQSVAWLGNVVYGRADMPDKDAYAIAKALDEQQDVLIWGLQHFSYSPHTVWKDGPVPLHPGAARYYRERKYMK